MSKFTIEYTVNTAIPRGDNRLNVVHSPVIRFDVDSDEFKYTLDSESTDDEIENEFREMVEEHFRDHVCPDPDSQNISSFVKWIRATQKEESENE